jgi:ATP-binding cassette, subfamily F, member 3
LDDHSNNASELSEMISGFLVSSDCASEDDAERLCSELLAALGIGETAVVNDEPSLLVKPTVLAKTEPTADSPPEPPVSNPLVHKNTAAAPPQASSSSKSKSSGSAKLGKKASASQRAQFNAAELEQELEDARVNAARVRSLEGAYKGALECTDFTLPNPGGGMPLLESASCTLVRGRRYGLIGRNGKGKSTMLRALAARRVGNIPASVTVHYVSQEVELTEITREQTPVDCVVAADVERRVLLAELEELDAAVAADSMDEKGRQRHMEVIEQLDLIDADSAERKAIDLLTNLGFSEELRGRPLKDLSGGWRVRAMLAAAIFARPDLLLLDEPTNHLSILAVMWLARELSTASEWKERIVVIVSHDR